jgi:phenylpropionate dioxygenase-like ring-hydroxylating dioxygenase large terminal subunit
MHQETDQLQIDQLVYPDHVRQEVYTDPKIFDLEMDRIFGRAWIYVGHESQIPKPGDYWTALIGRNPVVMVRDKLGQVHVLHNRCPHKGAKVVAEGCGNAGPIFRCPYHAWTFKLDGSLMGVPHRSWYEGTAFDPSGPEFSMSHVARVASQHGFVFCSLSENGPDLKTFLGGAITTLNNFVERAPAGRVEVAGGVQRVWQESNWKLFLENMNDTAHSPATHESSYTAARQTAQRRFNGKSPFQLHIIEGNGEPSAFWEALDLRCFDYGHSYFDAIFSAPSDEISLEYRNQLVAEHGEARTKKILEINRHNTVIYPSCSPHVGFQQLRVIRPVAVNRTMIEFFTFRLVGTSDRFFQRTINYTNIVNSPSSLVMVDDVDLYRRCQEGMNSIAGKWISHHRHAGKDTEIEGGAIGKGVSELPMRNQFRAWRNYMEKRDLTEMVN